MYYSTFDWLADVNLQVIEQVAQTHFDFTKKCQLYFTLEKYEIQLDLNIRWRRIEIEFYREKLTFLFCV